MRVTLQLPEPIGQELLGLPDRDDFASSALTRALEERRQKASAPVRRHGRRLDASEVKKLKLPPVKSRESELAWRRSHLEELQSRFAGQWVVLEGEQIVAAHPDAAQATKEAREKGISVPFVFYVEKRQPGVVDLGL